MSRISVLLIFILTASFASGASLIRAKRQQFRPAGACTVSHQEINELIRITKNLNTAMEDTQPVSRFGDATEIDDRDMCAKQLGQFRGTVQTMLKNYKSLNQDTMSQTQYERAKAKYQTQIQSLLKKIDNLKRDVESSYREEIDKLSTTMQSLKVQLDDNLSLLEKAQNESRSARISLCIANVRAGRIEDALKDLKDLTQLPYERIVTEVYEDQPENTVLVLNFLEAIDLYYEPVRGYEKLYSLMKRNNQLNGIEGRRLLLHIMALMLADNEQSRRATTLLETFKANV
ncbi:uncharacterized protein LOC129775038 [Toxorhynchites rutilus septentrionalis]|uniref:uncharacterized protein LOC129775038 n=1 Tax=Toxorhynchites rutilus septentrionalis TaxID=329112 RepID=UPI00247AA419|nr:uncharacterized protein LOC129775038 [Toxorhynchites rutilus septentrionalis]